MTNTTEVSIDDSFSGVENWTVLNLDYNAQLAFFLSVPSYTGTVEARDGVTLIANEAECTAAIPQSTRELYVKEGACWSVLKYELAGLPSLETIHFGSNSFSSTQSLSIHGLSPFSL